MFLCTCIYINVKNNVKIAREQHSNQRDEIVYLSHLFNKCSV